MACTVLAQANDNNIILSNYSVVDQTVVQVGCRQFGRRLTSGASSLTCSSATWTPSQTSFKCEWNGTLNTYEKLIIGLSSAAAGVLLFGILLICCLAVNFKDKRKDENEVDSYPPSAINEKVGYAQYGDGYGGGGGGIRGYRPSGKYEKQIIPGDSRMDSRNESMKRDPILWSGSNSTYPRETERTEQTSGYQFYTGKNPSSQYDNRAFERNDYDRGIRLPRHRLPRNKLPAREKGRLSVEWTATSCTCAT